MRGGGCNAHVAVLGALAFILSTAARWFYRGLAVGKSEKA